MSKQQVTNTWKDGLNSDLNPMITPNTVLTDNLNGTLITYNGNEFSLQNDMGNRREGQLTDGFYPIGIAEHGGVLYIVSINNTESTYIRINKSPFNSSDFLVVNQIWDEYKPNGADPLTLDEIFKLFTSWVARDKYNDDFIIGLKAQYLSEFEEFTASNLFEIGSFPSLNPDNLENTELEYTYRPFYNLLSGESSYVIITDTSKLPWSEYRSAVARVELIASELSQATTEEDHQNVYRSRSLQSDFSPELSGLKIPLSINKLRRESVAQFDWFSAEEADALFNGSVGYWTTENYDHYNSLWSFIESQREKSSKLDASRIDTRKPFRTFNLPEYDLKHPVSIEAQPSYDGSVNLILNDNKQPTRLINSEFAVIGDGSAKFIDRHFGVRTNYYEENKLDSQTRLIQMSTKFTYIDLGDGEDGNVDGLQSGGELKGGNYTFYLRYGDSDGNKTDIICESGIISVFNGTPGDPNSMIGTLSNELTDKLIMLTINNIDTDFSKIYLSYVREYSDANGYRLVEAKELIDPYVIDFATRKCYITGFEKTNDISIEDLNIKYHSIGKVKTITQQQSMLFLGNVESTDVNAELLQNLSYQINAELKCDRNIGYINPKNYMSMKPESSATLTLDLFEIDPDKARVKLLSWLSDVFPANKYPDLDIKDVTDKLYDYHYYSDNKNIIDILFDAISSIKYSDEISNYLLFSNCKINEQISQIESETPSEYYDPKNIYYHLGYWPGEYYRFGVVYIKNDGSVTDAFNLKGGWLRDIDDWNNNAYYHKTDYSNVDEYGFLNNSLSFDNIYGVFKFYIQDGEKSVISTNGITPYYLKFSMEQRTASELKKLGIIGYQIVRQKRIPSIICQGLAIGVSENAFIPMLYNTSSKDTISEKSIFFLSPKQKYDEKFVHFPSFLGPSIDLTFPVSIKSKYTVAKVERINIPSDIQRKTDLTPWDRTMLKVHIIENQQCLYICLHDYIGDNYENRLYECIDPNDSDWSNKWASKNYFDGGGLSTKNERFDFRTYLETEEPNREKTWWDVAGSATNAVCINYEKYKYLYIGSNNTFVFFNSKEEFDKFHLDFPVKPNKYFSESFITKYLANGNDELAYSRNLLYTEEGEHNDKKTYVVQLEHKTDLYKDFTTAFIADSWIANPDPTLGTIGIIMRATNVWSKSAQSLAVVTEVSAQNWSNFFAENCPLSQDEKIHDCIVYVVRFSESKKGKNANSFATAWQMCQNFISKHSLESRNAEHWQVTLTKMINEYDKDFKKKGYVSEVNAADVYEKYNTKNGERINFATENLDAETLQIERDTFGNNRYISTDEVYNNAFGLLSPEVTVTPELQSKFCNNSFDIKPIYEPAQPLNLVPGSKNRLFYYEHDSIIYPDIDDSSSEIDETGNNTANVLYIPRDTQLKTINSDENNFSLITVSTMAGNGTNSKDFRFIGKRPLANDESHTDKKRYDFVRGQFTDFLLCSRNNSNVPGAIVNINIPDNGNVHNEIMKRSVNSLEYYAVTNKTSLDESVNAYRGDCYTNTVTVRIQKNFIDATAPISETIVSPKAWQKNYEGLYNDNTKWNDINVSDLNTVDLGHWVTFKCLSNCNLALRSEDTSNVSEYALLGQSRSFYPARSISTSTFNKMLDTTILNHGYDATVSRARHILKDKTPYDINEFGTRVMFSNIATSNTFTNGYRIFQGMSYKDYPTTYGDIIKLLPWGQNLFCVFEHGIAIIPVNPKALMNTTTEDTIHIYGYGVLPEDVSVISQDFGSIWADSVIRTPLGIYGVDTSAKKIWQYTDSKGLITISDMKIQRFLNDHINIGLKSQEELGVTNVKTHYNMYKGDVMFTFYNEGEEWNLCYNERQGLWITKYSWIPLLSANVDNTFYSIELRRYENAEAKASKTEENRPFGIWKHGRTGVDRLILPTKWYKIQEPFEFEFVAGEPMGIDKIFENLKITSNNVQPESFDFQIIGDDYLFNKARIYEVGKDPNPAPPRKDLVNYYHEYNEWGNIPYLSAKREEDSWEEEIPTGGPISKFPILKDDLYLEKISENPEIWEPRENYSAAFYNASLTYDKVLDEYTLVVHQDCKNKQSYGIRRGNIQYKENGWDTNIEPLRYNAELKRTDKDFAEIKEEWEALPKKDKNKNFVSAKLRDKWLKVRIKYKGDRLAIIGAVTTIENISYA